MRWATKNREKSSEIASMKMSAGDVDLSRVVGLMRMGIAWLIIHSPLSDDLPRGRDGLGCRRSV